MKTVEPQNELFKIFLTVEKTQECGNLQIYLDKVFFRFFSQLFPISNFQRNAQGMRLSEIVG